MTVVGRCSKSTRGAGERSRPTADDVRRRYRSVVNTRISMRGGSQ